MTPSVFIGIPSNGSWQAEFGMALAGLMTTLTRPLKGGAVMEHVRLWNTKGSILPRSRTTLVQNALKSGCSHILFLDSDMVFPASTLHRLLQWDKAVVACNCPVKTLPSNPTARLAPTDEHPAGWNEHLDPGSDIHPNDDFHFDPGLYQYPDIYPVCDPHPQGRCLFG